MSKKQAPAVVIVKSSSKKAAAPKPTISVQPSKPTQAAPATPTNRLPRIMFLGRSLTSMIKAMTLQMDLDAKTCAALADRLASGPFKPSTITTASSDAHNSRYTNVDKLPKLTDEDRKQIAATLKAIEADAKKAK